MDVLHCSVFTIDDKLTFYRLLRLRPVRRFLLC